MNEIDPKRPHARAGRDSLGFWPVDWCHFVFLTGSIILFMVLWLDKPDKIFDPVGWSLVDLVLLVLLFFIVKKSREWKLLRAALVRMLYAALTIPLIFTQLGSLVPHVNPSNWEEKLRAFDIWLFRGTEPLAAMEPWNNPWLTEFLTWIYNYYYFIAIIVGVAVVKEKRPRVLARVTFAFVLCIYLSYVGYYVIPASGPNHLSEYSHLAEQHVGAIASELYRFEKPLEGVWLTGEMRRTMYFIEKIKQDCFPSGHTAVALLALLLALRYARQLIWVLTPLVVALIFSTMYLRYHYVADVLAGILLAVFSGTLGIRLHEFFERKVWGIDGNESGTS